MKQKNLFLVLFLFIQILSFGQTFEVGNLKYTVTSGTNVNVSSPTIGSITGILNIPASVVNNGTTYSVTAIRNRAFINKYNLTAVTIPNSVTSIGSEAFRYCTSLTSVTIANSVTSIDEYAFSSCSSLTSVSIPNSVTSIGNYVFQKCSSLSFLTIPNAVASIGFGTFEDCTSLTSVSIPNSVTFIFAYAFSNCTSLTSLTIPNSVTGIGGETFYGCTSLASVSIPNSVTSIGVFSFANCTSLTSVICEIANPLSINASVFQNVSLPSATLYVKPASVVAYQDAVVWQNFGTIAPISNVGQTFVADNLLYTVTDDTNVSVSKNGESCPIGALNIPASVSNNGTIYSVTSIFNNAFESCSSLTDVFIPSSVISIGDYAFFYCSSLTSVSIPNSVASIGEGAFYFCSSLTDVSIPNSITSISDYAFAECSSLTSVSMPNTLIFIGGQAFESCISLESITIPNTVTSIAEYAFSYCSGLSSISIPNAVTSISDGAFYSCESLTSVTIPNAITSISELTFAECTSLSSVYIPDSVTSIGFGAFFGCTSLASVNCEIENPVEISDTVFQNVELSDVTLYVPSDSVSAYETALVWQDFSPILPILILTGPTTTLETLCDGTLTSLSQKIYFQEVPEAQEYTFSITNAATNIEHEIVTTNPYFRIIEVPNFGFNNTYAVKGKVKVDDSYGSYGAVCTLQTPERLGKLRDNLCNQTFTKFNENLRSIILTGATAYKFKLVNGANTQEVESATSILPLLSFANILPNTTYQVSVAIEVNGAWLPYGEVCNITTPAIPTTTLRASFCNGTSPTLTRNFRATTKPFATAYRFKTTIGVSEVVVEKATPVCNMSEFAGAMMNQTYSIQVAMQVNGVWGPYGDACNWTVGTVGTRLIDEEAVANASELFDIKAYPNPFVNQITLALANENKQSDIMVYDMTGKLIQQVSTDQTSLEIGNNWSNGIYLVQIVQGQETKNIRIVKQ